MAIRAISRTSATAPRSAAAATIAGDISSVRPVGEPWRPLKLRLLEEAQISSPTSLSGFIARHIEQPASRHSKPAARKTSSRPSRLGLARHLLGARHDQRAHVPGATRPVARDARRLAQVRDAAVGAGADEGDVDARARDRRARRAGA